MAGTIYFQVNRHSARTIEQSEFQQTFQLVKNLVERQVRFASEIAISNANESLDRAIFANEAGKIIYRDGVDDLILSNGESLSYVIQFKNEAPLIEVDVSAAGKYGEYQLSLRLMILEGNITGINGSRLSFSLD